MWFGKQRVIESDFMRVELKGRSNALWMRREVLKRVRRASMERLPLTLSITNRYQFCIHLTENVPEIAARPLIK